MMRPVISRIHKQMMAGDPQTIVPKLCNVYGEKVLSIAPGGYWVIDCLDPKTKQECPESFKKKGKISWFVFQKRKTVLVGTVFISLMSLKSANRRRCQ